LDFPGFNRECADNVKGFMADKEKDLYILQRMRG
jgi:hypothetical protein